MEEFFSTIFKRICHEVIKQKMGEKNPSADDKKDWTKGSLPA